METTTKKTTENIFELKARGYQAAAEKAVKEAGLDATQCTLVDNGDKGEHLYTIYATDGKVLGNARVLQRASRQEPYTVIVKLYVQEVAELSQATESQVSTDTVDDDAEHQVSTEPKELTREEIIELVKSLKAAQDAMIKALTKYRENIHCIDVESAVRDTVAEYGADTLGIVLATEAAHYSNDGRMSPANTSWGKDYVWATRLPADKLENVLCYNYISGRHHMTIFDDVVTEFRKQLTRKPEPVEEVTEFRMNPSEEATMTKVAYYGTSTVVPSKLAAVENDAINKLFGIDANALITTALESDTNDAITTITNDFMRYRAYVTVNDDKYEFTVVSMPIMPSSAEYTGVNQTEAENSFWDLYYTELDKEFPADDIGENSADEYDWHISDTVLARTFYKVCKEYSGDDALSAAIEFIADFDPDYQVNNVRFMQELVKQCAPSYTYGAESLAQLRESYAVKAEENLRSCLASVVDGLTIREAVDDYWYNNIQSACC